MDENTLHIVASNLTIAYFSIKTDPSCQAEIGNWQRNKSGHVEPIDDKIIKTYRHFHNRLAESK